MGMFDWVNAKLPCPKCGHENQGWQSKDGPCHMKILEPSQVNEFYTSCDECGEWLVYSKLDKDQRNGVPWTPDQVKEEGFKRVKD